MRLLVTIVTHVSLEESIVQGFLMMKYALNHPWKFVDYKQAFLAGWMQAVIAVTIECSTFFILLFMSENMFKVLANYAIVLLIIDIGSNFYINELDLKDKSLITDAKYKELLKWEITTSASAKCEVKENLLKRESILDESLAM